MRTAILVFMLTAPTLASAQTVLIQGRLTNAGGAVDGSYGASFSIWDAAADGGRVWAELTDALVVTDEVFSHAL